MAIFESIVERLTREYNRVKGEAKAFDWTHTAPEPASTPSLDAVQSLGIEPTRFDQEPERIKPLARTIDFRPPMDLTPNVPAGQSIYDYLDTLRPEQQAQYTAWPAVKQDTIGEGLRGLISGVRNADAALGREFASPLTGATPLNPAGTKGHLLGGEDRSPFVKIVRGFIEEGARPTSLAAMAVPVVKGGSVAERVLKNALAQGGANVALDLLLGRTDPKQLALSAGLGAGLGGGLPEIGNATRELRRYGKSPEGKALIAKLGSEEGTSKIPGSPDLPEPGPEGNVPERPASVGDATTPAPQTLSYKRYRTGIGTEYKSNDMAWHGSTLRDVKAHAAEQGATQITVTDTVGHVQRPRTTQYDITPTKPATTTAPTAPLPAQEAAVPPVEARPVEPAIGGGEPPVAKPPTVEVQPPSEPPVPPETPAALPESIGHRFAAPLRPFEDVSAEVVTSKNPVVRAAIGHTGINPSVLDDASPVGRALTAYARQRVASEQLTQTAVSASLDAHAKAITGRRVIAIGTDGSVKGIPIAEGQSAVWQDVFSRPGDYTLTPKQRAYVDDFHQVIDEVERLRRDAGLKPMPTRSQEGWLYTPRQVKGVRGVEIRRPSSPRLQRIYDEAQQGVKAGIKYDSDPRATLELHVRSAYREIADRQLSDALEPLSITAKKLVPEAVRTRMENAVKARLAAERARRALTISRAIDETEPATAQRLRGYSKRAGKGFEFVPGKMTNAQRAADAKLAAARSEYNAAKNVYGRKIEAARKAEVSPGALWGPNQPDTIAIGQWRNRFFPREQADQLNETLAAFGKTGQKQNWIAKGFEILGNQMRFLASVGDFATPFTNGLPVLGKHPLIWGNATAKHYRAFLDPSIQGKLVREYLAEFQEMAQHGTPIGDAEYFNALKEGGGISLGKVLEIMPKGKEARGFAQQVGKQTFGRFGASYNTLLATSRAQLTRSLKHSIPDAAGRQQIIRNMTGGLDSAALGVSPDRRGFEAMWMAFSPRLLRSTVALTKDAMRGPLDPVGREALTSLSSLAAGVTGLYITAGVAQGKSWDEIKQGLNPLAGKKFLSYNVNGDWIGVGGQLRALTQLVAGLTYGTAASIKEGERPGVATTNRFDNPLIAFAMSRGAPGQNIAATVMEGLSPDSNADPYAKVDGPLDIFKQIGMSSLPFALQGVLEGQQPLTTAAAEFGARTSAQTFSETPEGKAKIEQKGLREQRRDAFTGIEKMGFESQYWREKLSPVGGDPSKFDTFDKYRTAYIERWTQVGVERGMSAGEAKEKATDHFDGSAAVKAWHAGVGRARLAYWKEHPDELADAYESGVEELNKDEKRIYDEYKKQPVGAR